MVGDASPIKGVTISSTTGHGVVDAVKISGKEVIIPVNLGLETNVTWIRVFEA